MTRDMYDGKAVRKTTPVNVDHAAVGAVQPTAVDAELLDAESLVVGEGRERTGVAGMCRPRSLTVRVEAKKIKAQI